MTLDEGWRWECASCDQPVAPMGMCETCGVFGIMRISLSEAVARLAESRNATLDEVRRAVEGLPTWAWDRDPLVRRSAVLDAVNALQSPERT